MDPNSLVLTSAWSDIMSTNEQSNFCHLILVSGTGKHKVELNKCMYTVMHNYRTP